MNSLRFRWLFRSVVLLGIFLGLGAPGRSDFKTVSIPSPRQTISLSGSGWQFLGGGKADVLPGPGTPAYQSASWNNIFVPHVFQTRADKSIDQGWYRRTFIVPASVAHKHVYLVFAGAASVADVYVNGSKLGEHRGAYTRFILDAGKFLNAGPDNELDVFVDNRLQSTVDCLPCRSGLYTVWGGLYRDVWLLATNDLQIDPTYYASPGIFITPSAVLAASANVDIKVLLLNASASSKNAVVRAAILDPNGNPIKTLIGQSPISAGQKTSVDLTGTVANPQLWSPESPNLYHVRVDVFDSGILADSLTQPFGFHSINWDFTKGLLQVNGKPYTLYGCDLHQEIESKASAVAPEDLTANIDDLKDLGANWVRLAHYPRAQLEYDLCDERGLFCWVENGHSHNDIVSPTADLITTEMVEQNYNHPSIIVWSVGNEGNAAPAEAEVPVVKALDPTRPVFVANMACSNADYRAANTYPGWYGGDRWKFREQGLISEIGAGGVVTSHCDYTLATHQTDYYEPEEYQQLVAEAVFELAFRRNEGKLGMFTWWNMREFNDTKYKSSIAPFHDGINSKGLETYAGDKKDVDYLYRCFLRPDTPTIHITSKRYFLREGSVDNGIKVYSNAPSVTLTLNGSVVSTLKNGSYSQTDPLNTGSGEVDNVFYWPVPLRTGKNMVTAVDNRGNSDSATIYFYGTNGLPEMPITFPLITGLASSNPANPAYYMDMPVQSQWPVYDDFDGTADNSLDTIPALVSGATWLALRRVTKTGQSTTVSFTAAKAATVYVIATDTGTSPDFLTSAAFKPVNVPPFQWRDNTMILVNALLYARHVTSGEHISLPFGDRDSMVFFKANGNK